MTPDQFRHYTPNEFNEVLDAKAKNRRKEWEFADMLNARTCEVIAKCAGNADAKPDDFLILSREPENRPPESTEDIGDKLMMLALSLGGKVVTRG